MIHIHPQYIIGIVDSKLGDFKIERFKEQLIFKFEIISYDISILARIKKRFNSGRIILKNDQYILKITKQLQNVISFFEKNKLINKHQHIKFMRFRYLYLKTYDIKNTKLEKEQIKFNKRLQTFL
jgi:hypothetical protein